MGKSYDACIYATGTGDGVAIGTNIDLFGVFRASADVATTITVFKGATQILSMSASAIQFAIPVAIVGPLEATSSGGNFLVQYRKRNV